MKKVEFENGKFYHIYNRGVDKRQIFIDDQDYSYFLHEICEFNNLTQAFNLKRNLDRGPTSNSGDGFVEINCFVLMPNHYHFIFKQTEDKGITRLMHKLGTGYAMYFNKKYKRTGSLFEGKYKTILIDTDEYLMHLSRYIHLNPVSIISPDWKDKGIKEEKKIEEYLKSYKWSSYRDYIGLNSISKAVKKDFIMEYFKKSEEQYEEFIKSWTAGDKEIIVRGSTSNKNKI